MLVLYIFIAMVANVRAAKVQYCQEMKTKHAAFRNNVTTMVYTMERKCSSCYKEINRLIRLKKQMSWSGHRTDVLVSIDKPAPVKMKLLLPEVDVDVGTLWERFGRKNGHVFVLDKCGNFAYEIIAPWSNQSYPYTAMATLSALHDAPCGDCSQTSQEPRESDLTLTTEANVKPMTSASEQFDEEELPESTIPFKIYITEQHEHVSEGLSKSYDVIELHPNEPGYHGHDEGSGADRILGASKQNDAGNRSDANGVDYSDDHNNRSDESRTAADSHEIQRLRLHYEPIKKWLYCAEQIMGITN